jgi:hypothetical protein
MSMTKEELATSNRRLLIGTSVAVVLGVGGAITLAPVLDKALPAPPPPVVEKIDFLTGLRAFDSRGYMMQPPSRQSTPVTARVKRPTLNCSDSNNVEEFEAAHARRDAATVAKWLWLATAGKLDAFAHGINCSLYDTGRIVTVIDCEYKTGLCMQGSSNYYFFVARDALEPPNR